MFFFFSSFSSSSSFSAPLSVCVYGYITFNISAKENIFSFIFFFSIDMKRKKNTNNNTILASTWHTFYNCVYFQCSNPTAKTAETKTKQTKKKKKEENHIRMENRLCIYRFVLAISIKNPHACWIFSNRKLLWIICEFKNDFLFLF